jgi:hypothetical protein
VANIKGIAVLPSRRSVIPGRWPSPTLRLRRTKVPREGLVSRKEGTNGYGHEQL